MPAFLLSDASPAEAWRPQLEAGTLWVADDEGPVGFLAATRDGDRLHIDEMDVEQAVQGQGVGRRLLAHAIDQARRSGVARVSLTTFRNVPWNAPFYASMGFAEDDSIPALQEHLRTERARGLTDRCAMVLHL